MLSINKSIARMRRGTEDFTAQTSQTTRSLWKTAIKKIPFMDSFNFIIIHYIYLISMAMIGSIILVPAGLPYIDSLFHAAGASTQSGLNTYVCDSPILFYALRGMIESILT
jgi:hypothetical protein